MPKVNFQNKNQTDNSLYNHSNNKLNKLTNSALRQFAKTIRSYIYFNIASIIIILMETITFLVFVAFFKASVGVTLALALVFLTFFSYNVINIYLQNKKTEQYDNILYDFLKECQQALNLQEVLIEDNIVLVNNIIHLAEKLEKCTPYYYTPPKKLSFLKNFLENFSIYFHWSDVNNMREKLLNFASRKYIEIIKDEPTNLELHAVLANIYVMESTIHRKDHPLKIWKNKSKSSLQNKKFSKSSKYAIEEFKILCEYAPQDPWVRAQLAYGYNDLGMYKKQMTELEIILDMVPNDVDTMFQLGSLYFQQGLNAKGLQIYENMLKLDYDRACKLIRHYGTNINA